MTSHGDTGRVRYSNPPGVGIAGSRARASQVARHGDLVLVSGQVGVHADGRVAEGFRAQTELVFRYIRTALESEGLSMAHVLKFTTYLTEQQQASEFSRVREELFTELYSEGVYPTNTTVIVKGLVLPELLIEVEAIAHA